MISPIGTVEPSPGLKPRDTSLPYEWSPARDAGKYLPELGRIYVNCDCLLLVLQKKRFKSFFPAPRWGLNLYLYSFPGVETYGLGSGVPSGLDS